MKYSHANIQATAPCVLISSEISITPPKLLALQTHKFGEAGEGTREKETSNIVPLGDECDGKHLMGTGQDICHLGLKLW